jgi:magnesium transporter
VQELSPDDAASHIEAFDRERAADILDEMDPDEAADILGDLDEAHAEDLLARMEPDEAADARELLEYAEDTAGGLMTTDFATLPQGLTAGEALARLRALPEAPDPLYHVYLVAEEGGWRLLGVVSLRALVLADPATPLVALQHQEFRTVRPDEPPKEVAHVMAEYDLPDLPVVDEAGDILGVVLIDDAIDAHYPDLWRRLTQGFR